MPHVASVETVIKSKRRRVSGAHLRAARDAVGLSQHDLALRLDVRTPTISERENSGDPENPPKDLDPDKVHTLGVPWETWLAWAMALGIDAEWSPSKAKKPKPRA